MQCDYSLTSRVTVGNRLAVLDGPCHVWFGGGGDCDDDEDDDDAFAG